MPKQRSMYGKDDLYVADRSNPKATRVTDVQKWRTNQDDIRHLPGALPMQRLAIQDGAIGPSAAFVIVDTEGGSPADELTTINPGDLHDGMEIELVSSDSSRMVTIKHSMSPSGIRNEQNTDISLDTQRPTRLKLVSTESLTYWQEIPTMKLTDSVSLEDSTTAASAKAVKTTYDLANTAYNLADNKQDALGFTPVQQGGAPGQVAGSKVRIGWDGTGITAYIDDTRFPLVTSSAGYTKAPYSSVADSVVSIVAAKGYSVPVVGGASAAVPPGDTWTIVCLYWIQDTGLSDVSVIGTVPGGTLVSSGNQIPANVSKLFLLCWRVE